MDWASISVRINSLGRVRCEPGWNLRWTEPDRLNDFDLWFVWAGEGTMRLVDRTVLLRAGTCLWMRPGRTYQADQDPTRRLGVTYIHFEVTAGGTAVAEKDLPAEAFQLSDSAYVDTLTRRIVDLMRVDAGRDAHRRVLNRAVSESLLTALVLGIVSGDQLSVGALNGPVSGRRIQQIQGIATRILEAPQKRWVLADLASEVGCVPPHFSRLFRRVTGSVPRAFIVNARIERACHLLRNDDYSLGEIALMLGYEDVFLFSRQFKDRTGLSPSAFRKRVGGVGAAM